MKPGDLLAVYGSLRQGEAADLSKKSGVEFVDSDYVNGRLYQPSWFPGLKTGYGDRVKVEVFRLLDEHRIRELDAYEGYPRLFDREVVKTADGRDVWVYTYVPDVDEDRRVASGDWLKRHEVTRETLGIGGQ